MGTGSLRIHFTAEDVGRIRIAATPDPLWEIVSSLHRLQTRRGYAAFADWHSQVRLDIRRHGLGPLVRTTLLPLVPLGRYFPDFLTPTTGDSDIGTAIDTVLHTGVPRIRREMEIMASTRALPPWTSDLARGYPRTLGGLGDALRRYYEVAVAPYWSQASSQVANDRSVRGHALLDSGVDRMVAELSPFISWQPPVLHVFNYPEDNELKLEGRGLTLIPSYFCWDAPISLADNELQPVLVYPALAPATAVGAEPAEQLRPLIGATRVAVLRAVKSPCTTTEVARRLGISPATASHHTTVLRQAGLIGSQRYANMMLHRITSLGIALLDRG
jgi:DNA-binding transcriptional ArsR family regulator